MTTKNKSQKDASGKGEVNHEVIAWALAGALLAYDGNRNAEAIVGAANRLGSATGEPETFDLRAEVMLRRLLDGHTSCAYDLDGQNKRKGRRAYAQLVALAGGSEGSPEPKDRRSCAWACWTMRRIRAGLQQSYTSKEDYEQFAAPRREVGVLFHAVDPDLPSSMLVGHVFQMLGPLVVAKQWRAFLKRSDLSK